jgi:plasmid stabilization system protein ParE
LGLHPLPAAERFLDAVEATRALIAELPRSGAARPFKHPALTGMRMMRVHGFEAYLTHLPPTLCNLLISLGQLHGYKCANPLILLARRGKMGLIFYLRSETGVDVVRVVHGARDLPTLFS